MRLFRNIKKSWGAIRWKMLIIFTFFSVVSTILIGCLSVAVLNVVIRREGAYLMEERITKKPARALRPSNERPFRV